MSTIQTSWIHTRRYTTSPGELRMQGRLGRLIPLIVVVRTRSESKSDPKTRDEEIEEKGGTFEVTEEFL